MYDVIIVGAGPCGSIAARAAAEKGANVILLERKKEVGAPVRCGEGIGVRHMKDLGVEVDEKCISSKINGSIVYSPDRKNKITVRTEESKGNVVDRKVFDKQLAISAGKAGSEISVKTEVLDVIKEGEKIIGVKVERDGKKEEIFGKIVIAADGGESTVARMAGLDTTAKLYDTDFGIEYEMANVPCEDMIEIFFSDKYAPRGYLWIFPKGDGIANVGVGIGGHREPYAKKYLDDWIASYDRLKDAQPVAIKGGIIPVGAPLKELVLDGFMVAGTAAHQVDPIHGGGIGLAMHAGKIAGEVAGEMSQAGKTDRESLSEYEKRWRKDKEAKLLKRLILRKAIEQLNDDDLNAILEMLDEKDIDEVLSGKFASPVKKVLTKRPQLLKILKGLIA